MASFNRVIILGNLTRDIALKYTPSQTAIAEFGIAANRKWKDQNGTQRDETCFVDCSAFGKPAETLSKYVKKGDPLLVEGRLTYQSWTAQDSSKRNRLIITIENFQLIKSNPNQNQEPEQNNQEEETPF